MASATPPEFVVAWPTLFVAHDWAQAHCVIPDGFDRGQAWKFADWQAWCLLNFYRVKPRAKPGQLAPAFFHRRGQVVGPQKLGKAPHTAAHICVEAVGPALFAGWAEGGEVWDCRDHGCGCGWRYEYRPGEAMGMPWPTPLIQITAFSEDQTDNIYSALRPMIDLGPLSELIPKTGEEFIRLPNGGRIDTVTSNAKSRLGARLTFAPQDETGIWTPANGMVAVAETQRRGLAGMGGRAEETTNAWNPAEGSVAQRTAEAAEKSRDIFRFHRLPPKGLSYRVKAERRKIHKAVYEGSPWVDLDAVEGEAAELMQFDAPQAERFFGNRPVAGQGHAVDPDRWDALGTGRAPDRDALIALGVDGARFRDALAIIATDVESGAQWPLGIWERPEGAPDDYEHPFAEIDGAMRGAFKDWQPWRAYVDPQYIDHLLEKWQGRWGADRVVPWLTSNYRKMAWAVRGWESAIASGTLTHDGDSDFARHVRNAHRQQTNVKDDEGVPMHVLSKEARGSSKKMDAAVASVLSWECRGDAIAAGATAKRRSRIPVFST